MPHFSCIALSADGGRVEEDLTAETEEFAIRQLHQRGLTILSLTAGTGDAASDAPAKPGAARFSLRPPRVKPEHVVALSRELAVMIQTGVPLTEALEGLMRHTPDPVMQTALQDIYSDVSQGRAISQALGAHPHIFPRVYLNMVRTAEASGELDTTLTYAADYLEKAHEIRTKVKSALTYPMIMMVMMIAMIAFMTLYLLPQFATFFDGMQMPRPPVLRIAMGITGFLKSYWWLPVAVVPLATLGGRMAARSAAGQEFLSRLILRVPVFGEIVRKVVLAQIMRTVGTMLSSGAPLLLTLETTLDTLTNAVFRRAVGEVRVAVEQGESLTNAVSATGVFPGLVCQMLAVGERTGQISATMFHVASYYEREADARLNTLTTTLEPIMIVGMGLVVAGIAISIITPIYSVFGRMH